MSGEVGARKRKNKQPAAPRPAPSAENGSASGRSDRSAPQKESASGGGGAGCCTRLLFYLTLSSFILVSAVIFVEYQPGQLREAYVTNVPKEVSV